MYPQRSVMTCGLATALEPPHFNPRTRVGCNRARMAGYGRFHASFNPRTRVECDCACPADACAKCCFNPRTRVGCDGMTFYRSCVGGGFQSTHPRRVRPRGQHPADLLRRVSIHAPAWGATDHWEPVPDSGAGFNPRTRVGCDADPSSERCPSWFVSIHAPAWGATHGAVQHGVHGARVSIHAPAWGATSRMFLISSWMSLFQSTHPRGVRLARQIMPDTAETVSIHAPAWGATPYLLIRRRAWMVSIHAPAWGATWASGWRSSPRSSFNPRTRVGCDDEHRKRGCQGS